MERGEEEARNERRVYTLFYLPALKYWVTYKHPDRARNNYTKGFSRDLNTRPFE